jgi:hypothetical protein
MYTSLEKLGKTEADIEAFSARIKGVIDKYLDSELIGYGKDEKK